MNQDKKQTEIIDMFNAIAPTYDTANRLTSMGIDIQWRKEACKQALQRIESKNIHIADIACGTGDMMIHWGEAAKNMDKNIDSIVGIDPSSEMVNVARKKIENGNFIIAEAGNIPLESNSIDIASIAYGLRNVVHRKEALNEFYRILKPRGVLVILEFTAQSNVSLPSMFMRFYTKKILPLIGGLVSRNFKAYKYLPNSIDAFVTKESLEAELALHGMDTIFSKSYSANVSTLIIAQKS